MIQMTLSEVAKILNIEAPSQNVLFQGVSTDTRALQPGQLYVAIVGERCDGHQFVDHAFQQGAKAALVSRPVPHPHLVVAQPIDALGQLSKAWRNRFNLPLIAVTGSNGKTTLKNMLASILTAACRTPEEVLATAGNLNNHIGVPLTLLQCDAEKRYGVIEMGMNHFNEIAYLTQLAEPQVAVITNAAESHLEGLKSVAGVAKAKGEIFQGLKKDGIAILNRDDPHFSYWQKLIGQHPYFTFGMHEEADFSLAAQKNQCITLKTPAGLLEVPFALLGQHNIMNALAAAACTHALKIEAAAIKQGLAQMTPAPGRMQPYLLNHNIRIIDDTYNANPFSLQAAINTLSTFSGKKMVILGDMKELGPEGATLHFQSGVNMRKKGIDLVFTYGELAANAAEGFGQGARHFAKREDLLAALKPLLTHDINLLIKGSRSMRMENILNELIPKNILNSAH